jgi:hypothetical protein
LFIQLKLKDKEAEGGQCKLLALSSDISGVIDAKDGVILSFKNGSQAVVVESYQTVKNRLAEAVGVI